MIRVQIWYVMLPLAFTVTRKASKNVHMNEFRPGFCVIFRATFLQGEFHIKIKMAAEKFHVHIPVHPNISYMSFPAPPIAISYSMVLLEGQKLIRRNFATLNVATGSLSVLVLSLYLFMVIMYTRTPREPSIHLWSIMIFFGAPIIPASTLLAEVAAQRLQFDEGEFLRPQLQFGQKLQCMTSFLSTQLPAEVASSMRSKIVLFVLSFYASLIRAFFHTSFYP